MGELPPGTLPAVKTPEDRLDSWKEIATYLNRDVTTTQRWEKREGMPVHRHLHDSKGSVYASREELDSWVRSRNLLVAQQNGNDALPDDTSLPAPPGTSPQPLSVNAQASNTQGGPDLARKRRTFKLKWLLLAVCLILIAAVGAWIQRRHHLTQQQITSLAVLPLNNLSGDPAQEYLADGMTEELIGRLSMIRGLRVISRTSVMQFKDTKLLAPEIARQLGVDALVEGSVIREGNRIRVHAQLIRASTDAHFWSETYDRELGDALSLESEVAQAITRKVEVTVSGEEYARLVAARPISPEVYEVYLKGLSTAGNTLADIEKRIAYFDEAIRRDPTFAPAYVGLARGYDRLGTIFVGAARPSETRPEVIRLAQKALQLDPDLPEAHVLLGETYMSLWRWSEAEAEFRIAFDLNPNDPAANGGLNE